MSRFTNQSKISLNKIWLLFCAVFILFIFLFCYIGINNIDRSSLDEQAKSLDKSIRQSVVHCYCVEGTYPPDLNYLKENYKISYNEELFYVDYIALGSNIMPDITIIPIYGQ